MKTPKPGQFCTINGVVYRAKKRINGCRGCALDNIVLCPSIIDLRYNTSKFDCSLNNIILVKV